MHSFHFSTSQFPKERQVPCLPIISAVQHVRRMRGGSQSHLMHCSDGKFYVVKFLNNPQHARVLVNEMLGSGLAELIGLPVPHTKLVQVDDSLIRNTPELIVYLENNTAVPCLTGIQFGSEYAINPFEGRIFEMFPSELFGRVRNLAAFAGMLAFDKWTGNVDSRQATFWRKGRQKKYTATFIDQGHCFNADKWTFPDYPLCGLYPQIEVYREVRGWESFEPWLSRIEVMDERSMWDLSSRIPREWSGGIDELTELLKTLGARRSIVRDLISAFRHSWNNPFPNWL
jgi:hypothetical protein